METLLSPPIGLQRGKGGWGVRGVKGSGDSQMIAKVIANTKGFPKICYTRVVWSVRHNIKQKQQILPTTHLVVINRPGVAGAVL